MIRFPFVAGNAPVHHCRLIGADPRFQALRERNSARLAALKASQSLYESKENASTATFGHPAQQLSNADYQRILNAQLAAAQNAGPGYSPFGLGGISPFGLGGISAFDCYGNWRG